MKQIRLLISLNSLQGNSSGYFEYFVYTIENFCGTPNNSEYVNILNFPSGKLMFSHKQLHSKIDTLFECQAYVCEFEHLKYIYPLKKNETFHDFDRDDNANEEIETAFAIIDNFLWSSSRYKLSESAINILLGTIISRHFSNRSFNNEYVKSIKKKVAPDIIIKTSRTTKEIEEAVGVLVGLSISNEDNRKIIHHILTEAHTNFINSKDFEFTVLGNFMPPEFNTKENLKNIYTDLMSLLKDPSIFPKRIKILLNGGPIIKRSGTEMFELLDLRAFPSNLGGYESTLHKNCSCVYRLSIGEYFYIGSSKNPAARFYYHHKKIASHLFSEKIEQTYINLESAVSEYGFTLKFEILKIFENSISDAELSKEEQIFINEYKTHPRLMNAFHLAYRSNKRTS
jgi:hypothetical protein